MVFDPRKKRYANPMMEPVRDKEQELPPYVVDRSETPSGYGTSGPQRPAPANVQDLEAVPPQNGPQFQAPPGLFAGYSPTVGSPDQHFEALMRRSGNPMAGERSEDAFARMMRQRQAERGVGPAQPGAGQAGPAMVLGGGQAQNGPQFQAPGVGTFANFMPPAPVGGQDFGSQYPGAQPPARSPRNVMQDLYGAPGSPRVARLACRRAPRP